MTMQKLGSCRIISRLGECETEPLYQALDETSGRTVAILILGDAVHWDAAHRERFTQECAHAAELNHPNILACYGHGWEGSVAYVVWEYVESTGLQTVILEKAPHPIERKISIISQAIEALAHAHARGVTHENFAPARVRLLPDGAVKVSGFGPGRLACGRAGASAPASDARCYWSPEQVEGKNVDARSDVFSLGIVFYELMTYTHPFEDADRQKALEKIVRQATFPTIERFIDLPLGLWPIIERCLAKNPDDRYASAAELLEACAQLQRDIADDRQLMLVELHTVLPRLAEAAQRPGAPPSLGDLRKQIERLLASEQVTEYLPLNRMISALVDHYRAIHSAFEFSLTPMWSGAELGAATDRMRAPGISGGLILPEAEELQPATAGVDHQTVRLSPGSGSDEHSAASSDDAPSLSGAGGRTPDSERTSAAIVKPAAGLRPRHQAHDAPISPNPAETDEVAALLREIERSQIRAQEPPSATATELADSAAASDGDTQPARSKGSAGSEQDMESSDGDSAVQSANIYSRLRPHAFKAGIIAAGLVVVFCAAFWMKDRLRTQQGLFVVLSEAGSNLAQRLFGGARESVPGLQSGSLPPERAAVVSSSDSEQHVLDILMEQARLLHEQGRRQESRLFAQRALEIRPDYELALAFMQSLELDVVPPAPQDELLKKLLNSSSSLIAAGKLSQAAMTLDRIEGQWPGLSEVRTLRARWEAKNAELTRERERTEAEQAEAARRQEAAAQRSRRAEELFTQGDYIAAKSLLDQWPADSLRDPAAYRLQQYASAALQSLSAYQSAMSAKRYPDALNALLDLERLNPSDPKLAELRRDAESRKAAASARLTVHRLRQSGSLLIDGQPAGSNGEIIDQKVGIGTHVLTLRTESGTEISRTVDLTEGQNVAYVYDGSLPVLRPMLETDRARLAERQVKEEVHRFSVEHVHGMLRGSCKGELSIGFYDVSYKPLAGAHAFTIPFRALRLMVSARSLRLLFAADGRTLAQFRAADAAEAEVVAEVWTKLKALDR